MSQTWENAQKRGIAKMGTRANAVAAAANGQAATAVSQQAILLRPPSRPTLAPGG
jgi:hypothetical protein